MKRAGDELLQAIRREDIDLVKKIVQKKKGDATVFTLGHALFKACEYGNLEIVQFILENGADPNVHSAATESGALLIACTGKKNPKIVELLLQYAAIVDATNSQNSTALIMCVDHDNYEQAKILLQHGANPNQIRTGGGTPLYLACTKKNWRLVKLLLEYGAVLQDTPKNELKRFSSTQVLRLVVLADGVNIDDIFFEEFGTLSFLLNFAFENHTPLVRLIYETKRDLEKDPSSKTAFHWAALHDKFQRAILKGRVKLEFGFNSREAIDKLIRFGGDANPNELVGNYTPLRLALIFNCPASVRRLLKNGVPLGGGDYQQGSSDVLETPFFQAIFLDHPVIVQIFLDHMSLDPSVNILETRDCQQRTPLLYAASLGSIECVKLLTKKVPNVAQELGKNNRNIFHHVALSNWKDKTALLSELMDYLLESVNIPGMLHSCDADGSTPLHLTVQEGKYMLEYLLQVGADPNRKDLKGKIAQDYLIGDSPSVLCKRDTFEHFRTAFNHRSLSLRVLFFESDGSNFDHLFGHVAHIGLFFFLFFISLLL